MITRSANVAVYKLHLPYIACENVKWHSPSRKERDNVLQTKYELTVHFRNFTAGHLYKKNENLFSHKNVHITHIITSVHSSFICNSLKAETTQMSFYSWMVNQTAYSFY